MFRCLLSSLLPSGARLSFFGGRVPFLFYLNQPKKDAPFYPWKSTGHLSPVFQCLKMFFFFFFICTRVNHNLPGSKRKRVTKHRPHGGPLSEYMGNLQPDGFLLVFLKQKGEVPKQPNPYRCVLLRLDAPNWRSGVPLVSLAHPHFPSSWT